MNHFNNVFILSLLKLDMSIVIKVLWLCVISFIVSGKATTELVVPTFDFERQVFCDRPWPNLEFFLPIGLSAYSDRNSEWSDVMMKSLEMFWPVKRSNLTVLLVLDIELKNSDLQRQFVDSVIHNGTNKINFPKFRIQYHTANQTYNTGHDRQQHMMFYADQYTDAEHVGFVDGDCMFLTNIDREDIFEDNKPIVHGNIG